MLALVAGVTVANTYYLQPLLHVIADTFGLRGGSPGLLVTVTQAGYVIGLGTLLPLGDRFDRRRLMLITIVVSAAFDLLVAFAGNVVVFAIGLLGLGVFSSVAQLAVTYAAAAAEPARRARSVAAVMAGLLSGIVLARTYAGWLAQVAGVRAVFVVAGVACIVLALAIARWLPHERVAKERSLVVLYRTAMALLRREPLLRLRAGLGFLSFAAFSMFWTTMALALSGPPFHLSTGVIGLFGFAGLAGVLAARVVGHQADRGRAGVTTVASFSLIALSWLALAVDRSSLLWFVVLTATLDAGIQGAQLSNQAAIYLLAPGAQGRVTMVYMVCYFLGGVAGSSSASLLYGVGGFRTVAVAGVVVGVLGLVIMAAAGFAERRWRERARATGTSGTPEGGVARLDEVA
nr:MFS transporter [Acidimicrobium ferrooxidans]